MSRYHAEPTSTSSAFFDVCVAVVDVFLVIGLAACQTAGRWLFRR